MKTNEISKSFKKTQNQIIKAIKTLDSAIIKKSSVWKHRTGGGGISCEMEGSKYICLLYTSPSPRDMRRSRMPSSA